jgi:glycine/D-amino acid oxidase-like deaminating enzyme
MPELTRTHLKELPLRPYPGYVFVTRNRKAFERASMELFGIEDKLTCQKGRFRGGSCWYHPLTYIVWYSSPGSLAHELSHVVLDLFSIIGIDPRDAGGEPFCYMLSQLIMETNLK